MTTGDGMQTDVHEIFEKCIGCKWTLHVLEQIQGGTHRPGQLERTAAGLTTKVLNERLVKLVRFGILEKTSFPEVPPRVEYHLTPFGRRFVEILHQVGQLQREFGSEFGERPAPRASG